MLFRSSWGVAGGVSLEPLFELLRRFILSCPVLHADETPLRLLDPGAGKTKRVYVWAWARSHHDPHPGVVYEFCLGRGAQYPLAFLGGKGPPSAEPVWNGTLITDQYAGYNGVLDAKVYPQRKAAACAAHARRRFEELSRGGHSASAVATEAMLRWTRIYRTEAAFAERLDTGGLPDPDLVVRTSGETRTSNFLPWQAAYSEYEFTETLWPDFGPEELAAIVRRFSNRERRFGGVSR